MGRTSTVYFFPVLKEVQQRVIWRTQRGREVRSLDLKSGDPELRSHSDH